MGGEALALTPEAVEDFRRSLDQMGEEQVKRILARGAYNEQRTRVAEMWLADQDDTKAARQARSSIRWAMSAAIAGWISVAVGLLALAATLLLPR